MVRDLHGRAGLLADADRLPYGVEQAVSFVADVADVQAAVLRHHAVEFDQLFRLREGAWHVHQACRQPGGAGRHPLSEMILHLAEFGVRWVAMFPAHCADSERTVGHEERHVRRRLRFTNGVVELADGAPGEVLHWPENTFDPAREELLYVFVRWGGAQAAIAAHDGRDALRRLEIEGWRVEKGDVVVTMDIDEAWRDPPAIGVDLSVRVAVDFAQRDDAAVLDGYVGSPGRSAGPIDDVSTADEQVELSHCAASLPHVTRARQQAGRLAWLYAARPRARLPCSGRGRRLGWRPDVREFRGWRLRR